MILLTWFIDSDVAVAVGKFVLFAAIISAAVILSAWLGTAFFAAIGLASAKALAIGGVFAALAKLPVILHSLL